MTPFSGHCVYTNNCLYHVKELNGDKINVDLHRFINVGNGRRHKIICLVFWVE